MSDSFLCLSSLLTASSAQARNRGNWSWYWPRSCSGTDDRSSSPSHILACSAYPRWCSGRSCILGSHYLLRSSTGFSIPPSGSSCDATPSALSRYGCAATVWLPAPTNWGTDDASRSCCTGGIAWRSGHTAPSWPSPHGRPNGGRHGRNTACQTTENCQDTGHDDLSRGRLAQYPSCKDAFCVVAF